MRRWHTPPGPAPAANASTSSREESGGKVSCEDSFVNAFEVGRGKSSGVELRSPLLRRFRRERRQRITGHAELLERLTQTRKFQEFLDPLQQGIDRRKTN